MPANSDAENGRTRPQTGAPPRPPCPPFSAPPHPRRRFLRRTLVSMRYTCALSAPQRAAQTPHASPRATHAQSQTPTPPRLLPHNSLCPPPSATRPLNRSMARRRARLRVALNSMIMALRQSLARCSSERERVVGRSERCWLDNAAHVVGCDAASPFPPRTHFERMPGRLPRWWGTHPEWPAGARPRSRFWAWLGGEGGGCVSVEVVGGGVDEGAAGPWSTPGSRFFLCVCVTTTADHLAPPPHLFCPAPDHPAPGTPTASC